MRGLGSKSPQKCLSLRNFIQILYKKCVNRDLRPQSGDFRIQIPRNSFDDLLFISCYALRKTIARNFQSQRLFVNEYLLFFCLRVWQEVFLASIQIARLTVLFSEDTNTTNTEKNKYLRIRIPRTIQITLLGPRQ